MTSVPTQAEQAAGPRPQPPPGDRAAPRLSPRASIAGPAAFGTFYVLIATAAQLLRQPGAVSWDTIWQEDGGTFLLDALGYPFFHNLVHPYNSYLHVGPRIVAGIVAGFPLDWAARLIAGGECLVVSLLSLYVYYASRAVLRTNAARVAVALAPVLLPAAGYETNAVLSDMHWYLIYAAFWALLANPRTRRGVALAAAIVGIAVLSDPLTAFLLPIALVVAWRNRRVPLRWLVPAVFAATLAVQLGYGLFANPTGRFSASHWSDLPGIYGLRVAGSFVVGDHFLGKLFPKSFGWAFVYVSLAVVLLAVAYGVHRRGGLRWLVALAFTASVVYLAVPLMERGTTGYLSRSSFSLNGSRYTVLPILFLVVAAAALLDRRDPRVGAAAWSKLCVAVCLWAAFVIAASYAIPTTRSAGPSWKTNLAAARSKCEGKVPQETTPQIAGAPRPRPIDNVTIFIAPNIIPPPWGVIAQCRQIERRSL